MEKFDCNNCANNESRCGCYDCVSAITADYDDYYGLKIERPSNWKSKHDNVNRPEHYQTKNGLETIDAIEAFTEDLTGIEAVCTGNIIKYVSRWKKKNGIEDLKKAEWYLQRLIRHEEIEESKNKTKENK